MYRKAYLVLAMAALAPFAAYAAENDIAPADVNAKNATQADADKGGEDTLIVRSTPTSQTMGTQIITAEQISKMPTRNGSVTELLKNNPNVQFANTADNGNTQGEIQPENVSFHGEKFYQNNYMIDGLSNNNTINPGANGGDLTADPDGYSPTDLPAGGAQSFWINSELIESLEVFDSNIAAKYGDFTGGVVDAKLKDPDLQKASGRVSFRTTSDSLTEYHVDETIQEDFNQASRLYYQPKFTKKFYSATINQPLSDKAGLIFSYNRQESEIPYYHAIIGSWENQKRLAETFLLKGNYLADNGDTFRATAMYAPHESTYLKRNVKNGAFTNEGGGYRFNLEWEHLADWGKLSSLVGYQHEQNHIEHAADYYASWYSRYKNEESDYINWYSSASETAANRYGYYGGYGEFETEKNTYTAKQNYEFNPFKLAQLNHQIDLGWQLDLYDASYRRFRDVYLGRSTPTWDSSTVCQVGDSLCIDGEQYYKSRTLYPARSVEGNYTNYAAYLQDSMTWGRLEVTPGIRVSYDNYLENVNIAPRLAASFDVFGDRKSRIFAGANRYYAQNMLAYKLRSGINQYYVETRTDASSPWVSGDLTTSSYDYDVSKLKTPYSDELNLGLSQRILDTVWTVKYVHRDGKNQFGRSSTTDESGQKYYVLTNEATTQGDTVSLTIEPISPYKFKYADVNWSLGANYSNNKSSSQTYYDQSSSDENMVIFKGKLMEKGDMDALDYNTPWTVFLNVDTHIPLLNLNWSQRLGYTSGYTGYSTSTETCVEGNIICGNYTGNATLYTEEEYDDYFSYDWRLMYTQPIFKDQSLQISLDILNVFNTAVETHKSTSSSSATTYKTGRQIWLGASWSW
ncbi:TonB-dependent receptor plug domain-containing protein [Acinetobacter pittii]|uniref:TonB-dependent receptor plug domain-containing protein n=1 Tax=Acinetobacter pittii TaxID=48296 RepID=UPI0026E9C295|nr:TonB-dependent receptor plug domain-containing protein [Acinetobacter pittii]MDO7246190.1 TonB-dependent receptor plug domain-containing protein [Acinetobacter pittii]